MPSRQTSLNYKPKLPPQLLLGDYQLRKELQLSLILRVVSLTGQRIFQEVDLKSRMVDLRTGVSKSELHGSEAEPGSVSLVLGHVSSPCHLSTPHAPRHCSLLEAEEAGGMGCPLQRPMSSEGSSWSSK